MHLQDRACQAGYSVAKMISISFFSQGKTSSIFEDVKNNNTEYVVLKNNQPTGVVVPFDWYQDIKNALIKYKDILLNEKKPSVVIGEAKDKITYPNDFQEWDDEIASLFLGV